MQPARLQASSQHHITLYVCDVVKTKNTREAHPQAWRQWSQGCRRTWWNFWQALRTGPALWAERRLALPTAGIQRNKFNTLMRTRIVCVLFKQINNIPKNHHFRWNNKINISVNSIKWRAYSSEDILVCTYSDAFLYGGDGDRGLVSRGRKRWSVDSRSWGMVWHEGWERSIVVVLRYFQQTLGVERHSSSAPSIPSWCVEAVAKLLHEKCILMWLRMERWKPLRQIDL